MRSEGLPSRQSSPRRLHRAINIRCRTLRYNCKLFPRGGIRRVEIGSRQGSLPCAPDEVSKAPAVTVQPRKCLARIFRRRAIFHGHEFFDDAHSLLPVSLFTEPDLFAYAIG